MSAAAQGNSSSSAAPASGKTVIVNIQEAIFNTQEGKKETDALNQRYGPRSNALKAQSEELEKSKTQLQAQGDKLSEDERNKRLREITDKQKAFQRQAEDFQNEVQQAEQEVVNRLGKKMLAVLEKHAKSRDYGVVVDVSNPQTTPVLWASPDNDITKELVEAYNAENPVSGAPATKPAAAAPKPGAPAASRPPAGAATTPKKP